MKDLKLRQNFLEFALKVEKGTFSKNEWEKFAVAHYQDDELENIRRDLVRIKIRENEEIIRLIEKLKILITNNPLKIL